MTVTARPFEKRKQSRLTAALIFVTKPLPLRETCFEIAVITSGLNLSTFQSGDFFGTKYCLRISVLVSTLSGHKFPEAKVALYRGNPDDDKEAGTLP